MSVNSTEAAQRNLEDELQRRVAAGAEFATLAAETRLPVETVVMMVARAGDRLLGPRRERDRRARSRTVLLETFEQRNERLSVTPGGKRMTNPLQTATDVRKRLDKAADTAGQNGGRRECPVCRRQFKAGRVDRITCSDHCRDLARRVRNGDPTADAAVRMLFAPPNCAGCGEPLWGRRPDAKHHGPACVKRRQRADAQTTASRKVS